jgi:hypothetical protein
MLKPCQTYPMRFAFPLLPAEFEIPDDWWTEVGMAGFTPLGPAYRSTAAATHTVPLREIEPPFRFPESPLDFQGFCRQRLMDIFGGFVAGAEIKPVSLLALPQQEWWLPTPFRYRVRDGFHRFYASIAAGFTCLPAVIS